MGIRIRMMRAENLNAWLFIAEAAEMRRQNRDVIEACEKKAAKANRSVRCTIRVQVKGR